MIELFIIGATLLLVVLVAASGALLIVRNTLFICEPNEVLIFSGAPNGGLGYRTIRGGRAYRIPLLEKVDRMDLTNMIIEVNVADAYSKGGIPLTIQGVANLKVGSHEPHLQNAIQRLMGKRRDEIIRIAKDVLEGNLRGVLSQLTPEQVNDDKLKFAEKLLDEAEEDLTALGLVLDTMQIQNVHDDRGYLDSIGRKSSAEIQRKSRIAEASARAKSRVREAENRERARLREIAAEEQIKLAEAERRIQDAKTQGSAMIAEAIGHMEAEIARAEAALEAEEARVEKVRLKLEADVIEPAKADMEAGIAKAQGQSARILEEGRATVKVLEEMIEVWEKAGDNARDIFLMQKLQVVLGAMVSTIQDVKIDRVTVLPGGSSPGTSDTVHKAVRLVEELKGALGVDLPKLLENATARD